MKRILLILIVLGLALVSCETREISEEENDAFFTCEKPADIPDTLSDGSTVYWDCDWQASYLDGQVFIKYDDNGGVKYIGRRIGGPIK